MDFTQNFLLMYFSLGLSSASINSPLEWLKNTKRDQWMSHVRCWRAWRGDVVKLLSMNSFRRLRSSRAFSQFWVRISEASFPHRPFRKFWKEEIKIIHNFHTTKETSYSQTICCAYMNQLYNADADMLCTLFSENPCIENARVCRGHLNI